MLINIARWRGREFWVHGGPVLASNETLELLFAGSSTKGSDASGMKDLSQEDIHMYNGILLSHKKTKIGSFVKTWTDLETVI